MANRLNDLAMQALIQATQVRQMAGLGPTDPVNIYDLAKQRGVEVRFVDIPSLEGMYLKLNQRPEIFISSHRPAGRQASTCGHELGHHEFKHGTQIDEYLDGVGELERRHVRAVHAVVEEDRATTVQAQLERGQEAGIRAVETETGVISRGHVARQVGDEHDVVVLEDDPVCQHCEL